MTFGIVVPSVGAKFCKAPTPKGSPVIGISVTKSSLVVMRITKLKTDISALPSSKTMPSSINFILNLSTSAGIFTSPLTSSK